MKKHICEYCNKEFKSGQILGGHKINCNMDPDFEVKKKKKAMKLSKIGKGRKVSEETKKKISKGRTRYLLENPDKVPYLLNHSSKISFPEKTMLKYLKQFNITGWVHQMQFSIYELDFAFPEYKLNVEIDGSTHLLESVIEKDQRRDKFLKEYGWKILRITAKQVKKNVYDCINLIIENLNKYEKIEIPEDFLNNEYYKHKKKLEIEEKKRLKKIEKDFEKRIKYEERKKIILNSNIDFKKLGWLSKLSKILKMSNNGIKKFMQKYMKEFYENCYKK